MVLALIFQSEIFNLKSEILVRFVTHPAKPDWGVGEILSTYGAEGFALVRLDRLDEAKASLTAGMIAVTLARPQWLDS